MQDIIEGNNIPLWRLFSIAVQASAILMLVALMPNLANHDESF